MIKIWLGKHLPIILSVILYILLYGLRWSQAVPAGRQGGWEIKSNLFEKERQILDKRISSMLPSPQAELLSGMILGEKKQLPGKLKLALRDSSTIHIVVVSGQNLTLLAGMIIGLSGLLTRRVAIVLAFISVCGYLLLSGVQIPALRAAIMVGMSYLGQLNGRQNDGIWALILTAALLLLVNPVWISDLSFILSFLATFGVVFVAPILARKLKRLGPFLSENLAVTLSAQIMVTPIIAQNFHQISLVSIPANILVLWTVPYVMFFGSLMIIFGSLFSLLTNALLTYFIYIVTFFSSLPFAWEYVGEKIWIVWVGYYMILAASLLSLNNGKRSISSSHKENTSGSSKSC